MAREIWTQKEVTADFEAILDALCWLVLERVSQCPGNPLAWESTVDDDISHGANLLSAVAYIGSTTFARRLLQDGHNPSHMSLFPSPMHCAMLAGNVDMVRLFREEFPDFDEAESEHGKFSLGRPVSGIAGAVESRNMDMIRLAIEPLLSKIPKGTDLIGYLSKPERAEYPGIPLSFGRIRALHANSGSL